MNYQDKYLKLILETLLETNNSIIDEDVKGGRIIAYHRTNYKKVEGEEGLPDKLKKEGFKLEAPGRFGVGVYCNYTWDGVTTDYSRGMYGNMIVELRLKNRNNLISFNEQPAKVLYGSNYDIESQMKKILGNSMWNKYKDNPQIIQIKEILKNWGDDTGEAIQLFYRTFKNDPIFRKINGMFYSIDTSENRDEEALVILNDSTVEPLRYTLDEGKTWNPMVNLTSRKRTNPKNWKAGDTKYRQLINLAKAGENIPEEEYKNLRADLKKELNTIMFSKKKSKFSTASLTQFKDFNREQKIMYAKNKDFPVEYLKYMDWSMQVLLVSEKPNKYSSEYYFEKLKEPAKKIVINKTVENPRIYDMSEKLWNLIPKKDKETILKRNADNFANKANLLENLSEDLQIVWVNSLKKSIVTDDVFEILKPKVIPILNDRVIEKREYVFPEQLKTFSKKQAVKYIDYVVEDDLNSMSIGEALPNNLIKYFIDRKFEVSGDNLNTNFIYNLPDDLRKYAIEKLQDMKNVA